MNTQSLLRIALRCAGAALLGLGCWLFVSDSAEDEVRRVSGLSTVDSAAFSGLPSKTATLVVGRLIAREPIGPEGFVVYQKEQYLRTETQGASKDRQQWMTLSVPQPLIAVGDGVTVVPVCNRDYSMANRPHRWQSDVLPTWRSVGDATIRLSGFKAGDSLCVDGVVGASPNADAARCIEAKAIFAGTPSEYVESVREGVMALKIVGSVLAGLGALVLGLGFLWSKLSSQRSAVKS